MQKSPEEMKRDNAEGNSPRRDSGGQMGAQKSGPREPQSTGAGRNPGRGGKPEMPDDEGGRVSPE
jgi:hypothetical protein